jgi:hypothetical protein
MGAWWSLAMYKIGKAAAINAIIEPRVGGCWYERGDDGGTCDCLALAVRVLLERRRCRRSRPRFDRGRALYFGYSKAVEKRLPGFFVQSTACILLYVGAAIGVARHLSGG